MIDLSGHGLGSFGDDPLGHCRIVTGGGEEHAAENDFLAVFQGTGFVAKPGNLGFELGDLLLWGALSGWHVACDKARKAPH